MTPFSSKRLVCLSSPSRSCLGRLILILGGRGALWVEPPYIPILIDCQPEEVSLSDVLLEASNEGSKIVGFLKVGMGWIFHSVLILTWNYPVLEATNLTRQLVEWRTWDFI